MVVTAHEVQELRTGARRAKTGEPQLHRLAALLTSLADLGRMAIDEDDKGIRTVGIPDAVEQGCRVARDLCRSPE
jgi:hypothetical protein